MNKQTKRECRPCTGCCDGWVQMVIDDIPVYPGHPCPHSTGTGCNAYDDRPRDPCGNFNCGWIMENSPLPNWMKPNNGKVIVIFDKLNWNNYQVDLAVPVGKRIPPRSLNWLIKFSEKNIRPLIYMEQITASGKFQRQQQMFGHGPPAFQQALSSWQREGKKFW